MEKYAEAMREASGLQPVQPVTRLPQEREIGPEKKPGAGKPEGERFFTPEIQDQLAGVFAKIARPLVLHLALDKRPVSEELRGFMEELCAMTDKLSLQIIPPEASGERSGKAAPFVGLYREDGTYRGIGFHGVPGGHEFNAFVIGLYNAAGPGQALEADLEERIRGINGPMAMQILVSLTCTLCPDLVMAAQRMAAVNPAITAEVYDLTHFPDLREQYQVMSVPCLVINDRVAGFGKKNIPELLDLLS